MAEPAERAPEELAQGELFADRYQIVESLGRGGMGSVYRARDLSLGEDIALKLLSFGQNPSPVAVLRFRKEVRLARRVTHGNVARVYDIGEHLGKLYLTMELVDGPTLRAVLRSERRLAVGRALEIGRALAAGLSAAHEVGVIHRDLKPSNILIDRSGRVVLSDFGIARGLDDEQSLTTGVLGTPQYMAPEQASGGVIDARVDVYAMGLVLYEMLTGERADNTPQLLADEMRAHGAPPALSTLVLHCLQRDPSARPCSTVEVAQRLATIAATAGGTSRPPPRALPDAELVETMADVRVKPLEAQPSSQKETAPDRALVRRDSEPAVPPSAKGGDVALAHALAPEAAFQEHLDVIIHAWSKTLIALGFTLIPLFFLLDTVMMPRPLLRQFGVYRLVTTLMLVGQYFVVRYTRPTRYSRLHGHFVSLVGGGMIVLMTHDLGGFDSSYYAGLNLVLFAVNLLVPWTVMNSVVNSCLIVAMYVGLNAASGKPFRPENLINNLYFMLSTGVIAVSINYVKHNLIKKEFEQRAELSAARDALRSEMELAKRIQTALLPDLRRIGDYEVAATMVPTVDVGGDYYDIIVTAAGERWVAIGDVSGHGVESGLIMMMTQTSIFTALNRTAGYRPSTLLNTVNAVIKQNITRLGTDRYMTISVAHLEHDRLTVAGKHQDILIYRRRKGITEFIPTRGTWLGILDDIGDYLVDSTVPIEEGDVILLFTDGVTEASSAAGVMFGERNLERALAKSAHLCPADIVAHILVEVRKHMAEQRDDITLMVLKRADASAPSSRAP